MYRLYYSYNNKGTGAIAAAPNPKFQRMPQFEGEVHMSTLTKKRRVMDHLAKGSTLTAGQARSRFGVGNLRATISDIKDQVEQYGNWEITSNETASGLTSYGMDFHGYKDNPFAVRAGL